MAVGSRAKTDANGGQWLIEAVLEGKDGDTHEATRFTLAWAESQMKTAGAAQNLASALVGRSRETLRRIQ